MKQNDQPAGIRILGEDIDFVINGIKLLHDVNFKIEEGVFTGLIGANGSGKTTLLKTIYRTYAPSRGAVYLDGVDIHSLKPKIAAQKIAVLPQEHRAIFDFPVIEMVMMSRYARKGFFEMETAGDEAICEQALRQVGLYSMRDRNFLSLSGGEKQRVLLAAAFAQGAGIIILDEPANHLDIGQQLLIMDIIKNQPSATVFASIHDLNLAARYCDKLIALKNGRIAAEGILEDVITPELIRELFRVEARIEREPENGRFNIRYLAACDDPNIFDK
ncbi:MAG: ABC transporter ATP-binding protein [Spirochaetaceae bacterium]|jgi:iron complex transport system ATP-binding protein|nr:ABC transporter ATP-binding protein [Spirochaetaceae bacterium]